MLINNTDFPKIQQVHQIEHTELGMKSKLYSEENIEWSAWRKADPVNNSIEPHFMLSAKPKGYPKPLPYKQLPPKKLASLASIIHFIPPQKQQYFKNIIAGKIGFNEEYLNLPPPKLVKYTSLLPTTSTTTQETTISTNTESFTHRPAHSKFIRIMDRKKKIGHKSKLDTDYSWMVMWKNLDTGVDTVVSWEDSTIFDENEVMKVAFRDFETNPATTKKRRITK